MRRPLVCLLGALAISLVAVAPSKAFAGWGWWGVDLGLSICGGGPYVNVCINPRPNYAYQDYGYGYHRYPHYGHRYYGNRYYGNRYYGQRHYGYRSYSRRHAYRR